MNMSHHGISLFMNSIVILAHLWCPDSISQASWNTRNHSPYEHFYVSSGEMCTLLRKLFLRRPHCFHSIQGATKLTKPSRWFMYILLCKITLLYSALPISKFLRHTCPVIGPHYYYYSTKKTLHIWSAVFNSKASYWHYTFMLYFPHILLSCYRCRRMRTFVLWSEMCLV